MNPIAAGLVLLCLAAPAAAAEPFAWQAATPESQRMSAAKLGALKDALAARGTKALLVVRNDRIVLEWYAESHAADKTHYTASMAKAVVGGLSLALAMDDGLIRLDDPAAKYVPRWKDDPKKGKITVRHLGSHTSGLDDSTEKGVPKEKLTGWKDSFWKRPAPPDDPFTLSRDAAPVVADPGKEFRYSNPGIAMLGYAVTAAVKDGPHKDLRTLLRERVMRPIGVADGEWSVGYGAKAVTEVDGLPLVAAWGGGNLTARAAARVGRLMLREGDWDGKRVVSAECVRATTADAGTPGPCGMGWWTNADGRYPTLPKDAYWGAGAGHQILLVVPSLKLVAVRNGGDLDPKGEAGDAALGKFLFAPLVEAVAQPAGKDRKLAPGKGDPPYPLSPVVTGVTWAPKAEIVRAAKDGDNWPLTWADDGHQYTAYGDGTGFPPKAKDKLSLGLARVEGGPETFTGVNVRSATAEAVGEGAKGQKASGILMVDGTLYLWVRNVGASRLGWSKDRGQTWEWADWKFAAGFGCPTFLNFGKNYDGARDDFVYVYSPDADTAYAPADRMVLARVPKDKLKDRSAYEFLESVGADGRPAWTADITKRGAAFAHAGRCYRSGVTYNPGLKRYLWCQILPESADPRGPRYQGGFGVFDAPEPWGPWTTAYFTNAWDVGPGETASFPVKWMSADGKTLHLVFSGDDCFSVRKATLTVADGKK
jgi:CubicO group peptidase (beta-lactamase class C family)